MQTEHSPFPSDETLAAYIDGRLDEETRRRVVEHMAECPVCLDLAISGNEPRSITADSLPPRSWSGRRQMPALPVAAAVAVLVSIFGLYQYRLRSRAPGLAALVAAA